MRERKDQFFGIFDSAVTHLIDTVEVAYLEVSKHCDIGTEDVSYDDKDEDDDDNCVDENDNAGQNCEK